MRIAVAKGSDLFGTLQKQNIHISAFCGGKEKCGKCKVRLISGVLPVTDEERRLLTKEEVAAGIRLACCHKKCESDVLVQVEDVSDAVILGAEQEQYVTSRPEDGLGIAVDIGTTTLAMAVIDLRDGHCVSETKVMNPQRIYGADVINRIEACQKYGVDKLQGMVMQEVGKVIRQVLSTGQKISRMVVCGNSTMEHIFLGMDPRKLSEYPYVCEWEETQRIDSWALFGELMENISSFPVIVMPNIAAFVGGDVVAGVTCTELDRRDKIMLIDLGTNGEMALSHEGVIYTTSTAAGPAFEGGNMVCGVASIPGAICRIQIDDEEVQYQILGTDSNAGSYRYGMADKVYPIGICGSGYIEGISGLLSHGMIDETGYMEQDIEIEGEIRIVPADIRNFQLAKSAIRSGINILCRKAGVSFKEIKEIYISGGFGKSANLAALINLKIIPKEFATKTRLLGNTALEGAIHVLLQDDDTRLSAIKARSICIDLANDPDFPKEYMKNMYF